MDGEMCLARDERIERGRRMTRSLVERSCRRCLVQLFPLTVWTAMSEREQAMTDWHCAPREREIEHKHVEAQRRADRARWGDLGPTITWAHKILTDPDVYAILDTETTGLAATSRIGEMAVTTASGTVLLGTLLNPGEPIPAQATAIHGITDAMVEGAPTFSEILSRLTEALAGRRIVVYNREYDTGRLLWELHPHHLVQGTVDLTRQPGYGERLHPAARAPGWTRRRGRSARWSSTPPSTATGTTTSAATPDRSRAAATGPWAMRVPPSSGWRKWPRAVGSSFPKGAR
ncbi:3'-5' exonuclease [Streptomyces sp. 110]|uniref:3'-5' exonuclease n=1 Tax=Streptomyces endocoffeicus TaxID=2898945 RepID=A0ABS1Q9F4_9ACTN|nr:3'-5' exonuclease [Streptomyces endocoffeicus]MBL1120581.1 3'-5' exonuclease [Streptomyces endocoffeicus]